MMGGDDLLIVRALTWLTRKAYKENQDNSGDSELQDVLGFLSRYPLVQIGQLKSLEDKIDDGSATWGDFSERYFLLPLQKDGNKFVPFIYVTFGTGISSGIVAGIHLCGRTQRRPNRNPNSLGIRYEEPHGTGAGKHDYFHAQFTNSVRGDGGAQFNIDLPVKTPAFPIYAENRLELFYSCLISMYGKDKFRPLLTEIGRQLRNRSYADAVNSWRPSAWSAV